MTEFIGGLRLAEIFYAENVKPIIGSQYPELEYSAGLIGSGSEVLGYDDEVSTDHDWGPRLMIFLRADDHSLFSKEIIALLAQKLPRRCHGYPTGFTAPDPDDNGTQRMDFESDRPLNHGVELHTIRGYFADYLGVDIESDTSAGDWLTLPQHKLLGVTSGGLFRDDLELRGVRHRFAYYPRDVWLYMLASGWNRIGQEEHLMGRAGSTGDEIGSAIIAVRLVRDIMNLCFLMERRYAPYSKWLGRAFGELPEAAEIGPYLAAVVTADGWQVREDALVEAYECLAARHNALRLTPLLPGRVTTFYGRPYRVIQGGRFARAIVDEINDNTIKNLTRKPLIGNIDQFSDSADFLSHIIWRERIRALYS